MGVKNYLIDGVSCAGKTTVCRELQRRGYHAIHGVSICVRDRLSPAVGDHARELFMRNHMGCR